MGDDKRPLSLNHWMYGYSNPVNYTDPSGLRPCPWNPALECSGNQILAYYFQSLYRQFGISPGTNINIPSVGEIHTTGTPTRIFLEQTGPGLAAIGDTGLSLMPGGSSVYAGSNAILGYNQFSGYGYTSGQRLSMLFWGVLGLTDCFPGMRFAPEGIGGGSPTGIRVSKFQMRFLNAIDDFVRKSLDLHPVHGMGTWLGGFVKAAAKNADIADNLLIATEGDEIVGILRIQNGKYEYSNALQLMEIETLNTNASQVLITEAAKESLDRGLIGMYGTVATQEGAFFATRNGAQLIGSKKYYWDLEAIYKLLSH